MVARAAASARDDSRAMMTRAASRRKVEPPPSPTRRADDRKVVEPNAAAGVYEAKGSIPRTKSETWHAASPDAEPRSLP